MAGVGSRYEGGRRGVREGKKGKKMARGTGGAGRANSRLTIRILGGFRIAFILLGGVILLTITIVRLLGIRRLYSSKATFSYLGYVCLVLGGFLGY